MSTLLRPRTITAQDASLPSITIDLPEQWVATEKTPSVIAGFTDDRTLSPSFATNIVVTAVSVPEETTLETWQQAVRGAQLSALPDLQVLDDRALPQEGAEDAEQWYHASAMTDEAAVTVLTRRWNRLDAGLGLTLTLTTLPLIDAQHGPLLDAVAASWRLGIATPQETPDDHA